MTRLFKENFYLFVNFGLLTAVLIFVVSPSFGVNLAAYSATHQHIYFGEVDLKHGHVYHDHAHETAVKQMTQVEIFQYFEESIAFLTDIDVGNLGLFYIALMMLSTTLLVYSAPINLVKWTLKQLSVQLIFRSPLSPPPR